MKPHNQSGFTYLEMLISLAILGLISVVLASSLDFGRQVWVRAGTYSEVEQTAVIRSSLRGWMQEIDDPSTVRGSTQSVFFQVHPTIKPHPDIFRLDVTLEIENGQHADKLLISLVGFNVTEKIVFEETRDFQSNLNNIAISYYGRAETKDPSKWHGEWDYKKGRLDLIKITAKTAIGGIFLPFSARVGVTPAQRKISASSLVPPD